MAIIGRPAFGGDFVRVLDEDVDLGRHVPQSELTQVVDEAVAPLLRLARGPTSLLISEKETRGHLGLLVLDGLIARHVNFGQIGSSEFVGPGDVLRPWVHPESIEMVQERWQVLTPARIAVLDREFALRVRDRPELVGALMDRSAERIWTQLLQSALRQAKRVDDRVLVALWHFAARWGKVSPEGRVVNMPNMTGEVLGRIVGARRQSVSTALAALSRSGTIRRRPDGAWVLPEQPPQLENVERGNRASDEQPAVLRSA
jgi:CRP/FNR family transcriptional regulator, cyclic AMP receptor protein